MQVGASKKIKDNIHAFLYIVTSTRHITALELLKFQRRYQKELKVLIQQHVVRYLQITVFALNYSATNTPSTE